MGTIAQKLTYLNDTKQLLKENINNLGGNLTNEPFRQYASVLEGIYESLPKVSGIGASLSLSPSLMGKIKLNEIQGDTLQNGTPTPSSPVPIQSVTGLQNVGVCGKNLLDTSSFYNGYVDSSGNIQSTGVQALFNYIRVNPGESYTISSQGTVNSLNIAQYDINKNFISRTVQSNNPRTFTLGNTTYYIRIWTKVSDDTPMTQEIVNGLKLQLEKGSTATTYEPYKGNTYEVNLGNIKLNKRGDYEDSIKKSTGKNLFDKTVITSGLTYTSTGTTTQLNNAFIQEIYIPVLSSTNYTISTTTNYSSTTDYRLQILEYDENKTFIRRNQGGSSVGNSYSITTGSTTKYVRLGASTVTLDELQFEQGSKTSYEPYGKVWYKTYNTGEKTLNGSETWETQWNGDNIHGWRTTIPNLKQTTEGSQSSYVISDYYETRTQDENFSTGSYGISNRANQSQIIIKNNDILNQNDFKTWLGTHNVKVKYVLATPEYEVITNTELINQLESLYNAKSKNGTTNINVTSEDLSMILNVSVIKGNVGKVLKSGEEYDAIIVDPPRSGLDKNTRNTLLEIGSKRIIYVSCDPITLARDLKELSVIYDIKDMVLVDMFPNTYHVESVVLLELKK